MRDFILGEIVHIQLYLLASKVLDNFINLNFDEITIINKSIIIAIIIRVVISKIITINYFSFLRLIIKVIDFIKYYFNFLRVQLH